MKTLTRVLLSTVIATFLLPAAAHASLEYGDDNYLGYIDPSNGNEDFEASVINVLRMLDPNEVQPGPPRTYSRVGSDLLGVPFVEANDDESFKQDNGNTTVLLDNTYQYILGKYGTAAMVWFFPNGISGEIVLPAKFVEYNNNGLSHTTAFNTVTNVVPEPGTIAVWGLLAVAGFFGVKKYQAKA